MNVSDASDLEQEYVDTKILPADGSWKGEHLIRGRRTSHRPSGGGGSFNVANMKARGKPRAMPPAMQSVVDTIREAGGQPVAQFHGMASPTVATYISTVRKDYPDVGQHIETVRGKGYRWRA